MDPIEYAQYRLAEGREQANVVSGRCGDRPDRPPTWEEFFALKQCVLDCQKILAAK
jgi:hypothetical protein